jgi:RING-variant domain/FHA domain
VGLGVTTIRADGTASPTSRKAMSLLEKGGNIMDMSKALNEHMYLVVRSLKHNN